MAGTSTDSNAAEQGGERSEEKKLSKKSGLLSKLPRLTTLVRKKTSERVPTSSQTGEQLQDTGTAIGNAIAKSGEMLAKVVSNDTGYQAGTEGLPHHEPVVIYASPGPMSAAIESSCAPWSSISSENNTTITTPGSSIDPKGKMPLRPGVLPDASPRQGSLSSDRRPSTTRPITWSALGEVQVPGETWKDKIASSETSLIDGDALNRVVTFDKDTRFAPSNRCSSVQYHERPEIRKSLTPWSEDPEWKLSERAQAHQKAVLAADPDTLPVVAKFKSAPEKGSSKLPVSEKKRVSSSERNVKANMRKEAVEMTDRNSAEYTFGQLKRAVPLPQEPEPKPELAPIGDPGYDKWTELGKEQKVKQRRELVSGISSYNWSTAQRHRTQPMAERMPIGPGGESAFSDAEAINYAQDVHSQNHSDMNKLNTVPTKANNLAAASFTNTIHNAGGVSPRTVPAMLPAVGAIEEEEVLESLSGSDSSTEPDSDTSSKNNSTKATRHRKASKSTASTTPNDSTRPSQQYISHPRSGSIDLDLLESKLVKAGRYEVKLTSSQRSSATSPNASVCGMSKLEMYRSRESGDGECRNEFESCAMKKSKGSWVKEDK
ncbi:hypothetical protein AC579_9504 [Pseudocercospora musae]|uniref:Uncharacterized protein n=1 Tax=Pseudocercospora musae TaxID=113226 RepID=A0A139IMN7_9PEZI|nr:hypothetical protein AC579_9504 [Pseudocercospora musae]